MGDDGIKGWSVDTTGIGSVEREDDLEKVEEIEWGDKGCGGEGLKCLSGCPRRRSDAL